MPGLAIYQRLKEPSENTHVWRYRRIQEARGVRTASIQGPFYIRPTQANGAQPWVTLGATTFDQAKLERDRKEKGEGIVAENGAGRMPIADAIASFLDLKKRKNSSTVENYTFILNEFLQQTSAKYIDQVARKVLDAHVSFLESKEAAPKTIFFSLTGSFRLWLCVLVLPTHSVTYALRIGAGRSMVTIRHLDC